MATKLSQRVNRRRVLLALGWYAGQIHHGVARFARDAGWILNLEALRSGAVPRSWRGDGVIAILGSNNPLDRQLLAKRVPIVNIGHGGYQGVPSVQADDEMIAQLAVHHFAARGFRHYAYYLCSGGPGEASRYRCFARALATRGFTLHPLDWASCVRKGSSQTTRHTWLARTIASLPKPLAAFGEFDDRAIEILHACESSQVPVPEQVAVLGVDNDSLRCDFAPVPLSSIDDDQEQQGYAAAAMLNRILNGERVQDTPMRVPPREVITRRSSDILAVEHPIVAGALRAIWEHFRKPILASDIAEMFPVSSRRLHDSFCKHIGHSIAEEIARKRVDNVKDLLTTTDKKLPEIARNSGFSSADHLSKVFTRIIGVPPSKYRNRQAM